MAQVKLTLSIAILWIYAAVVHVKYVHRVITEKVAFNSVCLQHQTTVMPKCDMRRSVCLLPYMNL